MAHIPKISDNILDKLFDKLNKKHIFANQNFTCCDVCGITESCDAVIADQSLIGYCFYHEQDRDLAIKSGKLWLTYRCKSLDCNLSLHSSTRQDMHKKANNKVGNIIKEICNELNLIWSEKNQNLIVHLPESAVEKLKHDIKMENEQNNNN